MRTMIMWVLLMTAVATGVWLLAACDNGDDDDDSSDKECNLDDLKTQTEEICGGIATFAQVVDSPEACGLLCTDEEVPYFYDHYGVCNGQCFCCAQATL